MLMVVVTKLIPESKVAQNWAVLESTTVGVIAVDLFSTSPSRSVLATPGAEPVPRAIKQKLIEIAPDNINKLQFSKYSGKSRKKEGIPCPDETGGVW